MNQWGKWGVNYFVRVKAFVLVENDLMTNIVRSNSPAKGSKSSNITASRKYSYYKH